MGKVIGLFVVGGFFALLERRFALRPAKLLRPGWKTDLLHFFFSNTLTELISVIPIGLVIAATEPLVGDRVSSQPRALQLFEALLLLQLTGYWAHRAMHQVPMLWRIHAVHHSSKHLDWLAAPRLHVLDEQLGRAFGFLVLRLCGFELRTIGAATVVLVLWAIFLHANVRIRFPRLRQLVATPEFHHWHHSNDPQARDKNFAGLFPWIDRLFGTYYQPDDRWPETYGVDEPVPEGYLQQQAFPFASAAAPPAGVREQPHGQIA
jgi:sterol desaturase/sphingolipid hydroxylase (fatty acid hydroxylase superfamily)